MLFLPASLLRSGRLAQREISLLFDCSGGSCAYLAHSVRPGGFYRGIPGDLYRDAPHASSRRALKNDPHVSPDWPHCRHMPSHDSTPCHTNQALQQLAIHATVKAG